MILGNEMGVRLYLHPSLVDGLAQGIGFDPERPWDAGRAQALRAWADTCDNPSGQRAALARGIASLIDVAPLYPQGGVPRTFWEAVGR